MSRPKARLAVTAGEHFFVALMPDGTIRVVGQYAKNFKDADWHLGKTLPDAWQVRKRELTTKDVKPPAGAPAKQ